MAFMDAENIRLTNLVERLMLALEETKAGFELPKEQLRVRDARIAELEWQPAAAVKNSANSSKPPSSDIIKPKPAERGGDL